MKNQNPSYSLLAKTLHWGFVIAFAYGIFKAVENIDQLENSTFLRFEVLFASAFLFMLAARYLYMKKTQKTSVPIKTGKLQRMAAKTVHLGMYLTLATIALTGLIIGFLFHMGFKDGVLIEGLIAIHEFGIPVMYWLIGIHITAAIFHRLLRDGVWNSMVPFWRE